MEQTQFCPGAAVRGPLLNGEEGRLWRGPLDGGALVGTSGGGSVGRSPVEASGVCSINPKHP